jgi:hypothetical protein
VFGSGEYERTHIADDIKKGIFKRDEVGSHVPGSQLGYGTQYDRDALKTQAFEQWSSDVREAYGDVAGLGADLAGGITTAWHDMPIVEGVMWLGGTGLGTFLGQAGRPIAAAFAAEQITVRLAMLFSGKVRKPSDLLVLRVAMNTFIATQNVDDQTTAPGLRSTHGERGLPRRS